MFLLKEHAIYFFHPNPMTTMMQRLQRLLSTSWLDQNSSPPWRELNCVDSVRLGGTVFAEIREYEAPCGHQNYLIELFDQECDGESIGLIYWSNLEEVINVLRESVHAIDALETGRLLND